MKLKRYEEITEKKNYRLSDLDLVILELIFILWGVFSWYIGRRGL